MGLLVIMAAFAAFIVLTSGANEKIRNYPYIVCGVGFVFTAVQLGTTIYREKKELAISVPAPLTKEQSLSVIITLGVSFAYIFLASIIGYFTMTFVFVAGYSFWHTKMQKKWMYIAVALGVDIVVYLAFKMFLNIPLPAGLLI